MNTTVNEIAHNDCPRCSGKGRIAAFSYNKGGSCFACSGTGTKAVSITRPMTDAEVVASLEALGLYIMPQETTKAPTGDWFFDLFPTEEEAETKAAAMIGARRLLEIA